MLASSWLSPTKLGLSCQVASASAKFITGELQGPVCKAPTTISTTKARHHKHHSNHSLAPQVPPEFWHSSTITTSVPNLNMDHWWQEYHKYQRPTNHRVNDKTPWYQETILLTICLLVVLLKCRLKQLLRQMFTDQARAWKYKSEELTSSPIWKYKSPSKVKVVWEDRAWDLIKL